MSYDLPAAGLAAGDWSQGRSGVGRNWVPGRSLAVILGSVAGYSRPEDNGRSLPQVRGRQAPAAGGHSAGRLGPHVTAQYAGHRRSVAQFRLGQKPSIASIASIDLFCQKRRPVGGEEKELEDRR